MQVCPESLLVGRPLMSTIFPRPRLPIARHTTISRLHCLARKKIRAVCSSRKYSTQESLADGDGKPVILRQQALTLLHKTNSLLPRILPSEDPAVETWDTIHFWRSALDKTYDDISSLNAANTKARIVIHGVDEWAGAQELVTALVEDPFTSNDSSSQTLRTRWKGQPRKLVIEYGPFTVLADSQGSAELNVKSSWLAQFPTPVQILECPPPLMIPSKYVPHVSGEVASQLLHADILVIVCNPLTVPIPALAQLARHILSRQNSILALTSSASSDDSRKHIARVLSEYPDTNLSFAALQRRIFTVDPYRALNALDTLSSNPTESSTVQRYQDDFLGSRISELAKALADIINCDSGSILTLKANTALVQVRSALDAGRRSIDTARGEISRVLQGTSELRGHVEELRAKVGMEVLGISSAENDAEDFVRMAIASGQRQMRDVLDPLTWWKMVWKVDDIGSLVGAAVERTYQDLETRLIFHTGRLTSMQRDLTSSTFTLLSGLTASAPSSSVFKSAVLHNELQQVISSPAYILTSESLTRPLSIRRTQLLQYPTPRLHRAAQQAVAGMFSGISCSAVVGWWMGVGEVIVGLPTAQMGTALGIGMLGTVLSMRWAVGKWERAKKRWMQDWHRVGEGVRRDLKTALEHAMDNNVTVVAARACERLIELAEKRRDEIEEVEGEVVQLEADLKAIHESKNSSERSNDGHKKS